MWAEEGVGAREGTVEEGFDEAMFAGCWVRYIGTIKGTRKAQKSNTFLMRLALSISNAEIVQA